jgi:catechol 2,3-dioxygenase-like lactoylglutathione lyase family enzyme
MFSDVLTVLYVADIERALRLYRDAFGMAETYRFPAEGVPEHVEVRVGTTTLGLSTPAGLASQGMPPLKRGAGQTFELAFGCDDVDAALPTLLAAGCTLVREPFDTAAGNRSAYVEDADGNRLSIYAKLKPARPR